MTLMSTYGSFHTHPNQKEIVRTDDKGKLLKTFNYEKVVVEHYNYCGAVDEHNAYWHDCGENHVFVLEETWNTTRRENCIFPFILEDSEVNAYLAMRYFG